MLKWENAVVFSLEFYGISEMDMTGKQKAPVS